MNRYYRRTQGKEGLHHELSLRIVAEAANEIPLVLKLNERSASASNAAPLLPADLHSQLFCMKR